MYAVQYVSENELPADQDWVMVRVGRSMLLFIKEHAVCPALLEEAWAGYRELLRAEAVPAQRQQVAGRAVALRG